MVFVVVTEDYAGLGLAVRLQEEGHRVILAVNPSRADLDEEERCTRYQRVGEGLVHEKVPLSEILLHRDDFRSACWIWDQNHSLAENEILRGEGFQVLGGGRHAHAMEHDRAECLAFVQRYGLEPPPSHRFEAAQEGIGFCENNPDTAYVYKPDTGDNFETFLPDAEEPAQANQELRIHLRSLAETGAKSSAFLLQERKEGVETNVEVWFDRGEPVFSFMTLECKRRYVLDLGELTGCAFDYNFVIPVDGRAVAASVGKLIPAYKEMRYTGFADANVIAAKDGIWFLEKCERFGYNAHPNLFWNLARRGVGEILASLLDGSFTPDFADGFGASVTLSTKPGSVPGKPIQFPSKLWRDLYFYDAYKRDDLCLIAGYDRNGDVLLVNAYGYTMPTAWEALMKKAAEVHFPYRHYRPDGDQTNFPSSPIRRYEALKAMGYI
jgi:phosphoribosylamine-glycine ligase